MIATASGRRPPVSRCTRNNVGQVATAIVVAQIIPLRNGSSVQALPASSAPMTRTKRTTRVISFASDCIASSSLRDPSRLTWSLSPCAPMTHRGLSTESAGAKTFDNEWILEPFERLPTFFTKRMFGGLAAYVFERQMLVLVEPTKTGRWRWHGVLICTERDHHASIRASFPRWRRTRCSGSWLVRRLDTSGLRADYAGRGQTHGRKRPAVWHPPSVAPRRTYERASLNERAVASSYAERLERVLRGWPIISTTRSTWPGLPMWPACRRIISTASIAPCRVRRYRTRFAAFACAGRRWS